MSGVFEAIAPPPYDPSGWDYVSPETSFNDYYRTNFVHGLGAAPSKICIDLVCRIADYEYKIGDTIPDVRHGLYTRYHAGFGFYIPESNTSHVSVLMSGGLNFFSAIHINNIVLTMSKWKYRLKASL